MKINVHFSNLNIEELYFTGKTSVVIDVLRASTVVVTALSNGARDIVPVNTFDFAMKISGNTAPGQTILGGERNTRMIEGFNLGNSPLEYQAEAISGKTIVHYTTNGSKAIIRAKFSSNLFVCCFNNLPAVANHLVTLGHDVEISCAGSSGGFNLEDSICTGRLITEMKNLDDTIELSDSAKACVSLNKSMGKNILRMLKNTEHGKLLIENGFVEDLKVCAQFGTTDLIPYYVSGSIKKMEPEISQNRNETEAS